MFADSNLTSAAMIEYGERVRYLVDEAKRPLLMTNQLRNEASDDRYVVLAERIGGAVKVSVIEVWNDNV